MSEKKQKEEINVFESEFVPKQALLSGDSRAELLKKLNISPKQLPKIKAEDPIAKILGAKRGDIIKVIRKTEGSEYYRVVV